MSSSRAGGAAGGARAIKDRDRGPIKYRASSHGEINANHYSNPALDLLIERSKASFDMVERRALLQRCMRMAMADRAVLPLFAAYDLYGMRQEIDWPPRLDGRVLASPKTSA